MGILNHMGPGDEGTGDRFHGNEDVAVLYGENFELCDAYVYYHLSRDKKEAMD